MTLLEIDDAMVEAVESYKKTNDFAQTADKHLMSKIVKVYNNLVAQICGVQADFLMDWLKGFQAFLRFQKKET